MFIVYFFDNSTHKIKVMDFASSLEDAQKKAIYYGKEYIEHENGRKHLENCIKDLNSDLTKELDGYYLIKNIEKVDLFQKTTKIDDVKGWTGTYQSIKPEINSLGYYSFVEFDSKLIKYTETTQIKDVKPLEKKVHFTNDLATALKEANFKPNKDCRFKFDINRKEQSIQTNSNEQANQTNFKEEPFNFPVLVGQIINNKFDDNDDYYDECDDYSDNEEITNVRSLIDDNIVDTDDSTNISFSDERYDLLANLDILNKKMKIDRFCESDSEYLDTDEEFDYDNSKETFLQSQLKEESLLYEPTSRIEKKSIGKVTFIKKAWKCD